MLSREEIQATLLNEFMSQEDNPWTIWYGLSETAATQLLNKDSSNVYTRQMQISPEIMAYDSDITINTELYRVTAVLEDNVQPDAQTNWWLSLDGGTTKTKSTFVKKESRVKNTHWHVFLKVG